MEDLNVKCTLDQFFFGFDLYAFEHLLGHLAEERFNEV